MTQSTDGWSTKAEEAPFPREVRLTLLDTNSVFFQYQLFVIKSAEGLSGKVDEVPTPATYGSCPPQSKLLLNIFSVQTQFVNRGDAKA